MRAIAFCAIAIPAVVLIAYRFLPEPIYAALITAVFALWLLTRARMIRIWRRLRGDTGSGWGNYFQE